MRDALAEITNEAHGTHATYRAGCHCDRCRRGASEYERNRRNGVRVLIDAAECRRHVRRLLEGGMSRRGIAVAAGVSLQCVKDVAAGETRHMQRRTCDAVMGISIGDTPSGHRLPVAAVTPLLEAMYAAGYSKAAVSRMGGWKAPWISVANDTWIMTKTHRRLTVLYELLARQGIVPADVLDAGVGG